VLLLLLLIALGLARAGIEAIASYQVREADRALDRQNYKEGRLHLEKALKMRTNSATLQLRLARVCRQLGLLPDADAHLKALRRMEGQSEQYQLEMLMLQAEAGHLDDVYPKLIVYVKEDRPEAGLVLEALVVSLLSQELYHSAGSYAAQWAAKEPQNVQALYFLAVTRLNVGQADAAVELLRRALARDPTRDDARAALGTALIEVNAFDAGAAELELCLQHQPNDPFAAVGLARCYMGKGLVQKAADLLDAALANSPDNGSLLAERGKTALIMGQPKEAEHWLRHALEIEPANTLATYQMEVCLTDLGRRPEAKIIADRRVRLEKDMARAEEIVARELPRGQTPALLHELGKIYVNNGRENGIIWLYKALEQDPGYQPTLEFLAEYYERKGDAQRANQLRNRLPPEPTASDALPGPAEPDAGTPPSVTNPGSSKRPNSP